MTLTPCEPISLQQAIPAYLAYLKAQGKSPRTLYTYGRDLAQVQDFFGPECLVTGLTLPLLGKFLKSDCLLRLSSGEERAAPTVQKTVRVLRQFLAWLVQEGYLSELRLPKSVSMGRTVI